MKRITLYLILILTLSGITFFIFMQNQGFHRSTIQNKQEIIDTPSIEEKGHLDIKNEAEKTEEMEQQPELKPFITIPSIVSYFQSNKFTITAIGDSLTKGVGDETEQGGYVGILERMINREDVLVDFHIFGKRGNRSHQLLERVQEEQEIQQAIQQSDIVIVTIGANDMMQVAKENMIDMTLHDFIKARQDFEGNIKEFIHLVQSIQPNIQIYFIGFYNPFLKYFQDIEELKIIVQEWNSTIEILARETPNMEFISTEDLFIEENVPLLADDHFHPNYQGYYRIAERVLEYIVGEES